MNDLFYSEREMPYGNNVDLKTVFRYFKFEQGEMFKEMSLQYNYLLFVKKGRIKIHCNHFLNKVINAGYFILLSKSSRVTCEMMQSTEIIVMSFDMLRSIFDKQMLKSYQVFKEKVSYTFSPLPIRPSLKSFLDLLRAYLEKGLKSEYLHEIKEKELFILLRGYYTREEIVCLLYPIIGTSDFKNFVLKNYLEVNNVAELVDLSGMGRTAFDSKFREEFGISARQWMLKQMAEHVRLRAMDPDVTIKGIMQEYKFNSPTHFNWFCRQQYGCTPGELLKKSAEKLNEMKI